MSGCQDGNDADAVFQAQCAIGKHRPLSDFFTKPNEASRKLHERLSKRERERIIEAIKKGGK